MNVLAFPLRFAAPAVFRGFAVIAALLLVLGLGRSLPAQAASGPFGRVTPITQSPPVGGSDFGGADRGGTTLSEDGKTALVSAVLATVGTTPYAGKAYLYHYANGQWTLAAELDDPDAAAGNADYFGSQGALSANGTVALIGAWGTFVNGHVGAGKAYLYTLSNGSWTLTHTFNDPAATAYDDFGLAVGLSANGTTAAVGAGGTTVNAHIAAGKAYIYSETNSTWSETAAIPDPGNADSDDFGTALAVSGDGNSILVGSSANVNSYLNVGKAYLYTLSNGAWTKAKEFDDPIVATNDFFGMHSVSLSARGESAAIAADGTTVNGKTGAGIVYMFHEANGAWSQTTAIADPDATAYDYFGFPLQMSASGTSVLIGSLAAVNGQTAAGKAYLYTLSNGTWTQTKEFDDPAAAAKDHFGHSGATLSGDGETAVIGAGGTTVNGQAGAGEAYIYQSPDDLSLALSARDANLQQYENVALDATVYNTDTAVTANNVVLSFTLPAGLSYIAGDAGNGSCSASGQTATCTLASLAPGATWQPTVMATATKTGAFTDTATVASNEPDPATANNAATVSVAVTSNPNGSGTISIDGPVTHSSGGGASTPLGLLALALLLGLAGLRRYVLQRKG